MTSMLRRAATALRNGVWQGVRTSRGEKRSVGIARRDPAVLWRLLRHRGQKSKITAERRRTAQDRGPTLGLRKIMLRLAASTIAGHFQGLVSLVGVE